MNYTTALTEEDLRRNIAAIRARMDAACQRSGRRPQDVRLLPVSKTVPEERLRLAWAAGVREMGENKVQEAYGKWQAMRQDMPGLRWCLIGHLQTNKARLVAEFASEFHALDSLRVARALDARLQALGRSLNVRGLMTLAMHTTDEPQVRQCFALLRDLRDRLRQDAPQGAALAELSMGMSGDFEWAIEEGATTVRVGQAIFGARSLPDSHYWPEGKA